MPYRTSSPSSLADGRLVAESLGISPLVVDISAQIDAYFDDRPEASPARRGNKMARERMTILYDHSVSENALVMGTSNKTELLLGYSTLHGDSAAALMPIGDLYKTQAFQLAEYLGVVKSVREKAPSADLWEGQTDEEELGFRYADVDRLLVQWIDRRQRHRALLDMGFDPEFVDTVRARVRSQQFKRKLPVVIKLSRRTVDKDFLYPRDWSG
jgi:NAD+ synthase